MPTVEDLFKIIQQDFVSGDFSSAKSNILFARSLYPQNISLMLEHYQVLLHECEYERSAAVLSLLLDKDPNNEKLVNSLLVELKPYLLESPLYSLVSHSLSDNSIYPQAPTYPTNQLKLDTKTTPSKLTEASPMGVFGPLSQTAKEKMLASCSEFFLSNNNIELACLVYSILIDWIDPDTNSPFWAQQLNLTQKVEQTQSTLPASNPYRGVVLHPKHVTKTASVILRVWGEAGMGWAAAYYLALCDWAQLATMLIAFQKAAMVNGNELPWVPLLASLTTSDWSPETCKQIIAAISTHTTPTLSNTLKFFSTLVVTCILVRNLHDYYKAVTGGEQPLMIINLLDTSKADSRDTKRRKFDVGHTAYMESLSVCVNCWGALSHPHFSPAFSNLWSGWGYNNSLWISLALGDMFMYLGDVKQAELHLGQVQTTLSKQSASSTDTEKSLTRVITTNRDLWIDRMRLQIAYCHISTKAVVPAARVLLEVLVTRPFPSDSSFLPLATPVIPRDTSRGNNVGFVPSTENEVLLRCVDGLIWCYEQVGNATGQVLVLLQANWGYYQDKWREMLDTSRFAEVFKFDRFFDYIVSIDILEEVAYLVKTGKQVWLWKQPSYSTIKTNNTTISKEEQHEMLETHLTLSSARDDMAFPALLLKFAAEELRNFPK